MNKFNNHNNNSKERKLFRSFTTIPKTKRKTNLMNSWKIVQHNLDYDSLMSRKVEEENELPYLTNRKLSLASERNFNDPKSILVFPINK